ncbi:MAG: hypothetical protein M1828_007345 [Chrysothrix sp. TS-e1954]|nr:MAG: hypothetical protein M1828_007345 [Chrysothrix sp. TS-e1954]
MHLRWVLLGAIPLALGQSTDGSTGTSSSRSRTSSTRSSSATSSDAFTFSSGISISTVASGSASVPTGSYQSFATQQSLHPTSSTSRNATTTSSNSLLIVGGATSTSNGTMTSSSSSSTSSAPMATNTQPCNGHPSFCNRRFMNFTQVCAHNSAFSTKNNAASNQGIDITGQLDDGIRMIQGETHWVNDTLYSCHTSCDLLNAGPLVDELSTVAAWVRDHPYDVLTLLLVNSDYRNATDYVGPLQDSGLGNYLYTPPKAPMYADDWPEIGSMILSGKRVVVFLDYMANQTQVPYILDEFSQMWETPFSPQDSSFPCTQQRPPNLSKADANRLPYLANHNLNIELSFGGSSLLIPQFDALNQTNSVNGTSSANNTGSLGAMATQCNETWARPPAWLLVDFYNYGNFPGSVFEVAAKMNNVTYDEKCCGSSVSAGTMLSAPVAVAVGLAMLQVGVLLLWS